MHYCICVCCIGDICVLYGRELDSCQIHPSINLSISYTLTIVNTILSTILTIELLHMLT